MELELTGARLGAVEDLVFEVRAMRKVVRVAGRKVVCRAAVMTSVRVDVEMTPFGGGERPQDLVVPGYIVAPRVLACRRDRVIRVHNATNDDVFVGSTRTGRAGEWVLEFDGAPTGSYITSEYRATVPRRIVGHGDGRATCLAAEETAGFRA
ncbi:hypothetical protein [Nocardioides sp. TF02-7]|uniref:hypothetical protein n=1 Tax=Nocardioides sp. TF02-7 TaxID=2917724 RepID=UPI001F051F2F|nr:hypothetical protein [Nocardioides sp. TF02-7]UMG93409.1 hypothetical protein MF408_03960 [Nocardioides sp. TF02-7]